ncbi:MAG: universal stress protein [Candidatus Methanomethylophilaceae archaeon]|jgi:nucleotide-binding universal stress UspA family protein
MAFEKILVPTDGSEFTKIAIQKAIELAKFTGGKITALYVEDQTIFVNMPLDSAIMNVYSVLKKEGQTAVDYVRDQGAKYGVQVEEKVVEGSPVKVIIEASADYDIIVMGTLGRTGMSKLMMGSVAERVVRYSNCPVMVVRSPEVENK